MENHEKFLKNAIDLKSAREQRSKEVSYDNLLKSVKKKIQTTMIGSLSDVENLFGFLWGFGEDESNLSKEQLYIKSLYEDLRGKILDRGNNQIKDMELEFINYEINRKKYYIKLPMSQAKGDKNDGN